MNHSLTTPIRIDARSRREGGLGAFVKMVLEWQERARQRHTLGSLDERLLRDLGITRADVAAEIEKPFWRV